MRTLILFLVGLGLVTASGETVVEKYRHAAEGLTLRRLGDPIKLEEFVFKLCYREVDPKNTLVLLVPKSKNFEEEVDKIEIDVADFPDGFPEGKFVQFDTMTIPDKNGNPMECWVVAYQLASGK